MRSPDPVCENADDSTRGMAAPLVGLFWSFVGVLVFWQFQRHRPFVSECCRRVINLQLTYCILIFAIAIPIGFSLDSVPLAMASSLALLALLFALSIWGAVRAHGGNVPHYPLTIPILPRGMVRPPAPWERPLQRFR